MSRNYTFASGEYYHLYARGVEKLPVFREESDYERFIQSLYLLNTKKKVDIREIKKDFSEGLTFGSLFEFDRGETVVDIGAYCLMPNHFHMLVQEKDPEGKGVSKFMQKLMTSYTMYFNKKNERTGALFGSSFKAQHVTDDNYLKYLFAYIHLNPQKVVGDGKVKEYLHSSYLDYVGRNREQKSILNQTAFPDYFTDRMEQEIEEWIKTGESPKV